MKNFLLILGAAFVAAALSASAQTLSNKPLTVLTNAGATSNMLGSTNTGALTNTLAATNATPIKPVEIAETPEITPTNQVRMNFHDVPLSTILNFLSARMGFVVVSDVEVRGNATIVSEQPVGTNEVLELLSGALSKNSYSVSRNGRVLTIQSSDTARNAGGTPVKQATIATNIPSNEEMATYVLPVHSLNPTQLIKDLAELIPSGATVAANEAGNAVVITAHQRDIRRFDQIINALDSSSVADVHVYVLRFADAKSVATELKDIFNPDTASSTAGGRGETRFRGFGFPGGGFPGGGEGRGGSSGEKTTAKANFTSDDQANAVVVSAPADYFSGISNIISELDQPSQDVTMVKVFHLKNADAQETADELSSLFSDDSTKTDANSRGMGYRFLPWAQPQTPQSNKSEHMTRQTAVKVVPDLRTASVIVTCSRDLMKEIEGMITQLDLNPAMKMNMYSFDIDHADPVTVQAALTALFSGPNTKTQTSTQTPSALTQREQSAAQQTTTSTTGFGTSGSGSGGIH